MPSPWRLLVLLIRLMRALVGVRALVLPKTICEQLNLDIGSGVNLTVKGETLLVSRVDPRLTATSIEDVFAGYDGTYTPPEVGWGSAVGAEAW